MAADDREELTVRLPKALMRRVREVAADIPLDELAADGLAMLLESVADPPSDEAGTAAEAAAPGRPAEARTNRDEGRAAGVSGEAAGAPPGGPLLPVLAVGDAALVLEGLAELRAALAAAEERERVTQVWVKTTLAELFVHTTPFPTRSDERRRREEAAERLARVDERVRGHVRDGRDANGTAGQTPATA